MQSKRKAFYCQDSSWICVIELSTLPSVTILKTTNNFQI
jgi:hypothetical protein